MNSEPLDPAAVMAAHGAHRGYAGQCLEAAPQRPHYDERCVPYRLAAEVTRLRAAEQRVRALHTHGPLTRAEDVIEVCDTCTTDEGDWAPYPCPTIAALDGAEEPPQSEPAERGEES